MYKKINKTIIYLPFTLFVLCAYLTFTNTWIALDVNLWQMNLNGNNKFFPIFTIGVLFIPPMLVLWLIKLYINKKNIQNRKLI